MSLALRKTWGILKESLEGKRHDFECNITSFKIGIEIKNPKSAISV